MPNTISIRTAQNVTIDYQVATVWDRIVGHIIDILIMISYIFFTSLIIGAISDSDAADGPSFTLFIIFWLPIMFYSVLFEILNNGQSPGKMVMNIKVVSLSGEPVTIGQYFLRWLFRIIDLHLFSSIVAVIVVAVSDKGQRVGDHVAGTSVISTKNKASLKSTIFEKIPDSYQPLYEAAVNLSSKDIQIVKEVLANKSDNRFFFITELAKKVEETLNIKKHESSETFLKNIVKDYNYFNSRE